MMKIHSSYIFIFIVLIPVITSMKFSFLMPRTSMRCLGEYFPNQTLGRIIVYNI